MRRQRWAVLLAGIVIVSVLIATFAEPWSGLKEWFGGEPADRHWARVAVGLLAFAVLLTVSVLAATGVPKALKGFGIEIGTGSGGTDGQVDDPISMLQATLRMNVDHVQLLGDYLRSVSQSGEKSREELHARIDDISLQLADLSYAVENLTKSSSGSAIPTSESARVDGGGSSGDEQ